MKMGSHEHYWKLLYVEIDHIPVVMISFDWATFEKAAPLFQTNTLKPGFYESANKALVLDQLISPPLRPLFEAS